MSGRATVLSALRTALGDVPGSESPDDVPVPRGRRADHAGPDVVGLFAERAAEYRATVVRVPKAGAAAAVGRALARTGARSVVLPPGLPEDLVFQGPWSRLKDVPPLTANQLDAADAVITTVATAIAVTGTVTLDHGPGQGRRALTLLPDQHVCVVRASQIAPDVPEALKRLDPYRPLTLVSGPSATSDIELDRVEGVHGPRVLDIVVIQDA
ncbi:LUD domain-containing protein [Streptomyces sp. ISL-22]|uniref:LutC/YkgG family protein n=1 Tax=unclassified Streptomyces TaxID=2593676 RepID=UPI001BEAC2B1|nr:MULTISPECIES: LUD domain-containing protein [unclassified Streptomyces]MBT2417353.1 LUD domain-containing protein [Streptomyces sp. ISL-24]MBT2434611.1 LUD domain-containing protein [Streptomyces sp. ISL-22]